MNKDKYSGSILEGTYNPIIFNTIENTNVLLLESGNTYTTDSLNESLNYGTVRILEIPQFSVRFDDLLRETFGILGFLKRPLKEQELKQLKERYNSFLFQIKEDFCAYTIKHEEYLQKSSSSVMEINRRKTLMKDYLLNELSEQLERCGLNGTFTEPAIEILDLRNWPIDERYNIIKQNNIQFVNTSKNVLRDIDIIIDLMSPAVFLFKMISNRKEIRKLNNSIKELTPISIYNKTEMESDINQLCLLSMAFSNIACIFREIYESIRPIMKELLKKLECRYSGNVDKMPKSQADALYTIKELFKELAEKKIIPLTTDKQEIQIDVCEYSDELSIRYNAIRETIFSLWQL